MLETVAAYAHLFEGKKERMVGTIKSEVSKLVEGVPKKWVEMPQDVVAGFSR